MEKCVTAAVHGPEKKHLKILSHEFHCKPVQKLRLGNGTMKVMGQLSHDIGLRPDDQVYYEFVVRNGTLDPDSTKIKINNGGMSPLIGVVAENLGKVYGVPISHQDAEDVSRRLAGMVTGRGWKDVAESIVASIAMTFTSQAR